MALTKEQKSAQLKELKENLQKAQSVVFTHYIGMTVADVSALRRKLRESGAEMKVAKKTLMRIAAKEMSLPEITEEATPGPVACIFSYADPVCGAQVALKFSKDHPQVAFLGGMFEGKLLSKTDAAALAALPSKQALLGMFAGMLQAPLRQFMSMAPATLSGFARAVQELSKKKEAAPA